MAADGMVGCEKGQKHCRHWVPVMGGGYWFSNLSGLLLYSGQRVVLSIGDHWTLESESTS